MIGRLVAAALIALPFPALADCPALDGADALIAERAIVVLGEVHGTAEMPEAIYRFACRAAAQKRAVVVGYEWPSDVQPVIDRFLATGDAKPLLAHKMALGRTDGLGSVAIHTLLRHLKALRDGGADVRFEALIDRKRAEADRGSARIQMGATNGYEGSMADAVARAYGRPNTFVVMSAGSAHTPSAEPGRIGALLRKKNLPSISIFMTTEGGTSWYCDAQLSCASHPWARDATGSAWTLQRRPHEGHDASLSVGVVHASPPAASR